MAKLVKKIGKNGLITMALFTFCWHSAFATPAPTPNVVVSIKPLHALVQSVLGGVGEAKLILTHNASIHRAVLKPSQRRMIENADIVFYIDASLEKFIISALTANNKDNKGFALSKHATIKPLMRRQGGIWALDNHHHEQNHHDDDKHSEHNDIDWHIWLAPDNAKQIVLAIATALSVIDDVNKNSYQQNAARFIERLTRLEKTLQLKLTAVKDKPFVVFHDAYQYFEQAFGLTGAAGSIVLPHLQTNISHMKAVRELIKKRQINCVFSEVQFSPKLIATATEGTSVTTTILDPLAANIPAGENLYFTLLHQLADNISVCLN